MISGPTSLIGPSVRLSSPPMIFTRLDEAINHPRFSAREIGEIISEDTALTARLLKLVNSAFFSYPRKIDTISHAITIVGTQQLRDLALATSVTHLFQGLDEELISMESFWSHSVVCGLAARTLASYRREANVERYFVAGILHDIGRLVIFDELPEQARTALSNSRSKKELLHKVEQEELGFDHAAVGGALMQAWKLPASLEEAVKFHHLPRIAHRYPVEAAIVHVSDIIANALELGSSGEHLVPPLDKNAWDLVGISSSYLTRIINEVEQKYSDAVRLFLPQN